MADGDDDEDDDDGDEGEEGEEGDGDSEARTPADPSSAEPLKPADAEMTDAAPELPQPAAEPSGDVEMKDESPATNEHLPTNPLTLAPPLGSLAAGPPAVEGSPLKNVVLPSPTAEEPPSLETAPAVEPTRPADTETVITESLVAEPPSTIVGEEPPAAIERDIPRATSSTEEALLPPPPDQVGNISSPKAETGDKTSEAETQSFKDEVQPGEEAIPDRPSLIGHDSVMTVMTEDSIRPDDSASTHALSGAPSEVGAGSAADTQAAVAAAAPSPGSEPKPAAQQPDLLDGLMSHLDRQSGPKEGDSKSPVIGDDAPADSAQPGENKLPSLVAEAQAAIEPPKSAELLPVVEPPTATEPPTAEPEPTSKPEVEEPVPVSPSAHEPVSEPSGPAAAGEAQTEASTAAPAPAPAPEPVAPLNTEVAAVPTPKSADELSELPIEPPAAAPEPEPTS